MKGDHVVRHLKRGRKRRAGGSYTKLLRKAPRDESMRATLRWIGTLG
jgi:hypothetical protein